MHNKKEKSNIIVRSIEIKDGKEIVVEKTLDNIQSETPLVSEKEVSEMFDALFPGEVNE